MEYTYLLVNVFAVLIPLIFSFHPKLQFYKKWKAFWPATLLSAIPFVLWDIIFTGWGIWGFNDNYLLGINFWNLPLEECLFFICIPYCCIYTYHCFNILLKSNPLKNSTFTISVILIIILLAVGIFNLHRWYTAVTFILLSLFLLVHQFIWKTKYLGRFYFTYAILIIPFFVVNGVLTGTGIQEAIVWYNNDENLGIRLLTIPVEDVFYGMLLILLNTSIYEKLLRQNVE